MSNPLDTYWQIRLQEAAKALRKNAFDVSIVENADAARNLVLNTLLPASEAKRVSFGGSMTMGACGMVPALLKRKDIEVLNTVDPSVPPVEMIARRHEALLVDLFITGSNAVTMDGKLVNLDMIGNRVGAIGFGPKKVVLLVGRNKLVANVEDGMKRVKEIAAPANAVRLNRKTPCAAVGRCMDCNSPERICNIWAIQEKCFPALRIHVVLINEDLGL